MLLKRILITPYRLYTERKIMAFINPQKQFYLYNFCLIFVYVHKETVKYYVMIYLARILCLPYLRQVGNNFSSFHFCYSLRSRLGAQGTRIQNSTTNAGRKKTHRTCLFDLLFAFWHPCQRFLLPLFFLLFNNTLLFILAFQASLCVS